MKPLPTLTKPLRSVDIETHEPAQALRERTDSCTVPAAGVVAEAMVALVLADAYREKFGGDHIDDVLAAIDAYRASGSGGWKADLGRRRRAPALVFIGFMGAGKSTARPRAPPRRSASARSTPTGCSSSGSASRSRVLRPRRRGRVPRARGGGRGASCSRGPDDPVIALGGGAVARRRVREALEATRSSWLDIDRRDRVAARRAAAGRWRATARASRRCTPSARRCTSARRRRRADRPREGRPCAPPGALARGCPGHAAAVGDERVGQYPVYVGRACSRRRASWPRPGAASSCPTRPSRALRRSSADVARPRRDPARRGAKTLADRRARAARAGRPAGPPAPTIVVALGGGVVGDLAGFCAAVYQRGVPVVQVPTTLVAQVDSPTAARPASTCRRPRTTSAPTTSRRRSSSTPPTLQTLPAAELAAGYAEVVKTALIAGGPLWDAVAAGVTVDDRDVIFACARTKLAVVAADERDGGRRQVLNLGHTVGHAIETVTGYARYRHGEAVGSACSPRCACPLRTSCATQVAELLAAAGLPTTIDGLDPAAVAAATRRDKKRTGEHVPFVLVDGPGAVEPGRAVGGAELLAAVAELAG
jgi:shikimate kinase/3-dehydroquinate synthase